MCLVNNIKHFNFRCTLVLAKLVHVTRMRVCSCRCVRGTRSSADERGHSGGSYSGSASR